MTPLKAGVDADGCAVCAAAFDENIPLRARLIAAKSSIMSAISGNFLAVFTGGPFLNADYAQILDWLAF
jgi:hypothetical protein